TWPPLTPDPSPLRGEGGSSSPLSPEGRGVGGEGGNYTDDLLKLLSSYSVCSKEWIIRQYDHEVQGGTVIKPLVGPHEGPGDAAVITPVLGSTVGLAVGCGINPRYGDRDPYRMAAAALDEAGRKVGAGRGGPGAGGPAGQLLLGQHGPAGGARLAGAGGGGVPRRGPGLRDAVHQRQGLAQQ